MQGKDRMTSYIISAEQKTGFIIEAENEKMPSIWLTKHIRTHRQKPWMLPLSQRGMRKNGTKHIPYERTESKYVASSYSY